MVITKRFAELRFQGGRFETAAISFDALPDLLVYRDLLVDLARHLWLQDHEGRSRAPRRFDEAFPLYLRAVEAGSARAIIERDETDLDLVSYQDKACTLLHEVVGAAGQADGAEAVLPDVVPGFPAVVAKHFNRFGRRLRQGEWIELQVGDRPGPRYDPAIGKRIALAYMGRYEEEVVLEGELGGLDVHRHRISIKTSDGEIVDVPECSAEMVELAVQFLLRPVLITVMAEFNRSGGRERVRSGRDIRPVRDEDSRDAAPLSEQFDRLRNLPPGWLEPSTPALDRQGLGDFQSFLERVVTQAACARPLLYPTEDGGARAEWSVGDWELAVTADLTNGTAEVHGTNIRDDEVRDLQVSFTRHDGIQKVAQFLHQIPNGGR